MLRGGVPRRRARRGHPAPARHGQRPGHRRGGGCLLAAQAGRRCGADNRSAPRHGARRSGPGDGSHPRQRLRGLAARSALFIRELRRRTRQPDGACRRDAGRRDGPGGGSRLQPALPACLRRPRQDASAACHRLGGEAAHAEGRGALPDGGTLPLPVRGSGESPRRDGLQGQVPLDRYPADRRSGVHARREDRAGVRAHHQLAARWRAAGGGGLGQAAEPARRLERPHALAPATGPRDRDRLHGSGAAAQDPREAGAREARRRTRRSRSRRRWWPCSPTG